MSDAVAGPASGLDHVDTLGYSGAAFRIHTLPREVLCPSTVSPNYGYKPAKVDRASADTSAALAQAKRLSESGQFGEYLSGTAAYDLWIQLLEADDGSDLMRRQMESHSVEDAGLPTLNKYCFLALLHAREAAGPFLRRRAAELEGEAADRLCDAAACYEQVAAVLKRVGKPSWKPESRQTQASALREARELERRAAVLLGDALTALP